LVTCRLFEGCATSWDSRTGPREPLPLAPRYCPSHTSRLTLECGFFLFAFCSASVAHTPFLSWAGGGQHTCLHRRHSHSLVTLSLSSNNARSNGAVGAC
jgi:hypothetical protein